MIYRAWGFRRWNRLNDFQASAVTGRLYHYIYLNSEIYNAPGHWDRKINWIEGQLWPEVPQAKYFHRFVQQRKSLRMDKDIRSCAGKALRFIWLFQTVSAPLEPKDLIYKFIT